MGAHSSLGASSAHRWMECPGSVKLSEGLPDTESEHSFLGTCAHFLCELCLTNGEMPDIYLGETVQLPEEDWSENFGSEFQVDKDMVDAVSVYVDYCNALPGVPHIEQRLDYSKWVEGGFGTGDYMSFDVDNGRLHVVDYKHGAGEFVECQDNKQLLLYGLGGWDYFSMFEDILEIQMTIVQPRKDNVSEWTVTTAELLAFAETAKQAAELARSEEGEDLLVAGQKQCRWCKVRQREFGCQAYDETISGALDGFDIFGDEDLTAEDAKEHMKEASNTRLVKILKHKSMINQMIKDATEQAEAKCLEGETIPGLKVVSGRKSKQYLHDEHTIMQRLKNLRGVPAAEVQTVKAITPAAAYKKFSKSHAKWVKANIEIVDGKPTVVPESDNREAIDVAKDMLEGFQ